MHFSQTELLKAKYNRLITTTLWLNIKLIISGPISNPEMSTETFSRTAAINKWLKHQHIDGELIIVDKFRSFWRKPHLFEYGKDELNMEGKNLLHYNIALSVQS